MTSQQQQQQQHHYPAPSPLPVRHKPLSLSYVQLVVIVVLGLAALVPFWMVPNYDAAAAPARDPTPPTTTTTATTTTATTTTTTTTTPPPRRRRRPQIHIVFSTSCTEQQHWESYVFFYHCSRVRQPGTVTRIVAGCSDVETWSVQAFHDRYITPLQPSHHPPGAGGGRATTLFHVHFTPDYSRVALEEGKRPYKYNNKPFGLWHFLSEHSPHNEKGFFGGGTKEQDVIALLDPDMVLLQPIDYDYTHAKNMIWVDDHHKDNQRNNNNNSNNNNNPPTWWSKVTLGQPIAQQDGYLNNEWTYFDRATIFANLTTAPSYPVTPPSAGDAVSRYNAGPPYLATVADWRRLARTWTLLAPPVLSVFPKLFAEMYSFVWATVYEQLPWQMTTSFTISTTSSTDREGWTYVDQLPAHEVCQIAQDAVTTYHPNGTDQHVLPVSLHYCGVYSLDRFLVSKYRVKKNIMNCNKNLLKVPVHLQDLLLRSSNGGEDNIIFTADWPPQSNGKPSQSVPRRMTRRTAQRELFMLCALTTAINNALRHYKSMACSGGSTGGGDDPVETIANLSETYEIFTDYSDY